MAVQIVFGKRRPAPCKLEELVRGLDRNLGRQRLGLGSNDLRFSHGVGIGIGNRAIDGLSRFFQRCRLRPRA
jgi:hypothetical protein